MKVTLMLQPQYFSYYKLEHQGLADNLYPSKQALSCVRQSAPLREQLPVQHRERSPVQRLELSSVPFSTVYQLEAGRARERRRPLAQSKAR